MPYPADKNRVEKLFRGIFTTKYLHAFGLPLHVLSEPLQLVGGIEVAVDRFRMMPEGENGIGLSLPPRHDLGVARAPPLSQASQGFLASSRHSAR